jgi:hypothetical protein
MRHSESAARMQSKCGKAQVIPASSKKTIQGTQRHNFGTISKMAFAAVTELCYEKQTKYCG